MPNTPRFAPDAPPGIEILAFSDVQLLDVAGPLQVFASATDLAGHAGRRAPYAARVIASHGGFVTSSAGLGLAADDLPDPDAPLDTLIVAGGSGIYALAEDRRIVDWVRARSRAARRVASVCSGAFLLGAAGLLDGRRVATHWSRCAELARRYPDAKVEADPIFIRDGRLWTSAGITAGIDLALAMVEADLGRTAALEIARQLVVFLKRPGGQAQFSTALSIQGDDARFDALHGWMVDHLGADLSVPALAREVGLSERSFIRHYRQATSRTPARAVEQLRVEAAQRMLGDRAVSIKRVAQRCGFGSEETMRRSFVRLLKTTPQDFRARFALGTEVR